MEKLAAAAREDFENIVKSVTEENKVYQIESAEDSVVLISYKEYENLQETIELLSTSGFRESLQISLQQITINETYSLGVASACSACSVAIEKLTSSRTNAWRLSPVMARISRSCHSTR